MPKFPTFPTLYDSVLTIDIAKLKQWGYLNTESFKSGIITWSSRGEKTGSISIKNGAIKQQLYIELDYNFQDKPLNYKISLTSVPSNLGKGKILYFICPQTNKRCRKLYSVCGYFLHRDAFNGCMYESQTKSKSYRQMEKQFGVLFKTEQLYEELYSKYFKKYYNGKPTKRYLKIMKQIQKAESISYDEIEKAIML